MLSFVRVVLVCILILPSLAFAQYSAGGISVRKALLNLEEGSCIDLSIHSSSPEFSSELSIHGISHIKHFNSYYVASICQDKVDYILNNVQIDFIELTGIPPFILNDSMVSNNKISSLHEGSNSSGRIISGKGVLLGFIDTGIDFTHPDFQDSLGNTRVLKIWDQKADTLIANRIPSFGYGQVWDSSDINSSTCPHDDDILSHGTNVAGIATGNGMALNKYFGVAQEADIICVASDFGSSSWLNTVADGVEYIFNECDKLNKPCVINISAGQYLGSHDGSDLAALRIDSMINAKNGRAVVAAAGNAGSQFYHLGYQVTGDTAFTWFQYNSNSLLGHGAVYYQLWSDTADFNQVRFSFGANKPSPSFQFRGKTLFDNISNRLNIIYTDSILSNNNVLAYVETYAQLMDDKYLLEVHMNQPDSNQYLFSLLTTGSGKFDVWSDSWLGLSHMYKAPLPSVSMLPEIVFYKEPDTLQTMVSSFTCLPSVITVGNYINRNSYLDYDSVLQTFSVVPGKKAVNSSLGPNRLGHLKPDLTASGDYTITANRLASIPLHLANNQNDRIGLGGMHKRNGGTSMAAPVVAGIVALLFEECSDMDNATLLNKLSQNTSLDSFTGPNPSYSYGHGKINAEALLDASFNNSKISPGGQVILCEPGTIELNGPIGGYQYYWSTGDSTQYISVDSSSQIRLTTIDSNGCLSTTDTVSVIGVNRPIKPIVSAVNEVRLKSTVALNYAWYKNNQPITGANSRQLKISSGGSYTVEVGDTNNCTNMSDPFISYLTVDVHGSSNNLLVYPNPSLGGNIQIECSFCLIGSSYSLQIIDQKGGVIKEEEGKYNNSLNLNLEIPGLYHYIFISESGECRNGKIVVR